MRVVVLLLALCAACYSRPDLRPLLGEEGDPATPTQPKTTPVPPPQGDPAAVDSVLARLEGPLPTDARLAEQSKLGELLGPVCASASATCRAAVDRLLATEPDDEGVLRVLAGLLQADRKAAAQAAVPLVDRVLSAGEPDAVDRAWRMAHAARVIHRGNADASNRLVSTMPPEPVPGQPLWIVVEIGAPCSEARGSHKGPDERGRIDIAARHTCPPQAQEGVPRAGRALWPVRLDAAPEGTGLDVWLDGGERAAFRWVGPREQTDSGAERGASQKP